MRYSACIGLAMLLLACPGLGAQATTPDAGPTAVAPVAPLPQPALQAQAYRIAPGDVISVFVWGQDRLTQNCQVNASGTISYPLLGDVPAAGLTCIELQARLQGGLQQYLKHPQVMARVLQYGAAGGSVFVLGEVKTPGVYPLAGGAGLMQTLAAAGGPTKLASGEVTIIKARTGEFRTTGLDQAVAGARQTPEAEVEPGDVVVVNRKPEAEQNRRYAVLGEVPTPGMFDMPAEGEGEVRVLDAMQKAGLLNGSTNARSGEPAPILQEQFPLADFEHALLTRGEVVVPVNLEALLRGDTTQNLLLDSGDVLTVPRRQLVTVYAMGEVRVPGRQMLPLGSTVIDLLNAVQGVNPTARLGDATLVHSVGGKPKPVPVNLGVLLRGADATQNVALQEGDVLFVPSRAGEPRRDLWSFLPLVPYLLRY